MVQEFDLPPNAASVALLHKTQVLLIQRAKAPWDGAWSLPGGRLEPGETAEDCAARELHEELGVRVQALQPVARLLLAEGKFRLQVFGTEAFEGEITPNDEIAAWRWVPPGGEAGLMTTPHLSEVLQRLRAVRSQLSHRRGSRNKAGMRIAPLFAATLIGLMASPVLAVDPPYQEEMERLSEIMGSLYFLQPLCKPEAGADWRAEMQDLITLDQPDSDRQQRLAGAFNSGYEAYARLYRACTVSADESLTRLLVEAEKTARDMHTRYAE